MLDMEFARKVVSDLCKRGHVPVTNKADIMEKIKEDIGYFNDHPHLLMPRLLSGGYFKPRIVTPDIKKKVREYFERMGYKFIDDEHAEKHGKWSGMLWYTAYFYPRLNLIRIHDNREETDKIEIPYITATKYDIP